MRWAAGAAPGAAAARRRCRAAALGRAARRCAAAAVGKAPDPSGPAAPPAAPPAAVAGAVVAAAATQPAAAPGAERTDLAQSDAPETALAEPRPQPEFPTFYVVPKKPALHDQYYRSWLTPRGMMLADIADETPVRRARRLLRNFCAVLAALAAWAGFTLWRIATSPEGEYVATPATQQWLLVLLPLRFPSRLAGRIAAWEPPEWLRPWYISSVVWALGIDLAEAESPDAAHYRCVQQLFTRRLRQDARPVDRSAPCVSPADGMIVRQGELYNDAGEEGWIDQIKGYRYKLEDLTRVRPSPVAAGKRRVFCVVWLSPKDYHRFHVPVDGWTVDRMVHVPGALLPVHRLSYRFIDELFCVNERVALCGTWTHGSLQYVAVGATNVGSIRFAFDADFRSNKPRDNEAVTMQVRQRLHHCTEFKKPLTFASKGDELGHFELGSTVVLIADVPEKYEWRRATGDSVRCGEALLSL
eukprot:TRINITY_DN62248_c0_g1_i1.p2 TRINITY_DN62248_c0_g1~~TRINITY_DN62248_c0_g1_i1.p2  ORF type:complete len:490 (+),score=144.80 TRINITY_DN62248_c0_g1_i1:60-1472(+)